MLHAKSVRRCFNGTNFHLLLGVILGLFLHANLTYLGGCGGDADVVDDLPLFEKADVFQRPLAPRLVQPDVLKNMSGTRRPTSKVVRPRYYSTELGIREKLFVGIFTSEEKISLQAVHINQTITHLVDKVKFFITAQRKLKSKFNLSGVVGFTDTRYRYRPFQVIKYIGDSFVQDYDYYFLMNDFNYLNAERLKDSIRKLSVKNDVYLGTSIKDGSYCDLDAGILISNSVLRAMKEHLDWCVINALTDDHSENIGRCVHHSIGLTCQDVMQGQRIQSYKVKHFSLQDHLQDLLKNEHFRTATTTYPITDPLDFYILHVYYSKTKLMEFEKKIKSLGKNLNESWPSGIRPGAKPATRFDLPITYYFNMTHMFFPDDFTNVRKHTSADLQDVKQIVDKVTKKVLSTGKYSFLRLVNGYRTFDMSRGIDYRIHLGFRDLHTGKEIIKKFEVCKPLGSVEFIPVPYVTENSRMAILLPVEEHSVGQAADFLQRYSTNIIDRREKALLMLVLLYQYDSESKGDGDPYNNLKNYALQISEKYHNEDTKIVWVSIRLPKVSEEYPLGDSNGPVRDITKEHMDIPKESIDITKERIITKEGIITNEHMKDITKERIKGVTMQRYPSLNFAVIDLSLKKIGLDTIVFVIDPYVELTMEFLNRVKMNTIENFQIFNPIPFRQYDPNITQVSELEVNKNAGHFDKNEYKYLAFYGKDYVPARKSARGLVPIIRIDNDIENLVKHSSSQDGNVFKMFLEHSNDMHCMRATDMAFKTKFGLGIVPSDRSLFLGNKGQLASFIMSKDARFQDD